MEKLVSVVIPTKDEERHIGICLDSLMQQTYPKKEIIVVDSNSTDRTREIARKKGVEVINKNCEMPVARNEGVKDSSEESEYVCMLDADTMLYPNWLEEGINYLERYPRVVAVCADFKPLERQGFKEMTIYCFNRMGALFLRIMKKVNISPLATGTIIRKKVFEKVGGYTAEFTPSEDVYISKILSSIGKTKFLKKMKGYASMRGFEKYGILRFIHWAKSSISLLFLNKNPYYEYLR